MTNTLKLDGKVVGYLEKRMSGTPAHPGYAEWTPFAVIDGEVHRLPKEFTSRQAVERVEKKIHE